MKVLKKGRKQTGWSHIFECSGSGNGDGGCGAKLLVEEPDLFRQYSHARDETTAYISFKCPECGVLTDITNSDRPGEFGHLLQRVTRRGQ